MKPADLRQRPPYFDLVRMLMDHQLLDANYVECGKVDDVELEIQEGRLRATAVFTGPGAAFAHLPGWMEWIATRLFGGRSTRLPWAEIALVDSRIKLRSTAEALGLDAADRRASRWVARLPRGE